jgi:hypothetical protein
MARQLASTMRIHRTSTINASPPMTSQRIARRFASHRRDQRGPPTINTKYSRPETTMASLAPDQIGQYPEL